MPKQKLFLLDAMALLYRAHFAFIRAPRVTAQGLNTSAVFGFTNTLLEILNKEDPSHLGVVFDTSAPTFRHVRYEAYKAHREAQPEDLSKARPYVLRLLEALDIPALELDGYEADDIIGTISAQVDPDVFDVYLVTPDKDYAQLVKENVFLYKPQHQGGGFDVLGAKEVEEKFGLPPAQIVDFLGLKGDAVDNIPGIPKIGEKIALELLQQYGTVENIIAHAGEISKKSIRETIEQHAEQGLLSKELARIMIDVPIDWSIDRLKLGHADLEALSLLMGELEFRTTAQRILNSKLNPMRPEAQRDLFGQVVGETPAAEAYTPAHIQTAATTPHSYHLLEGPEAFADLVARIQAAGRVCFDTETTGLDPMTARLVGMSFAIEPGEAYFVHTPADLDHAAVQAIVHAFAGVLTSNSVLKIGQNLKYDILVLRKYDLEVRGPMFDTMLAHYVLNPDSKHGMDAMAEELLHYQPISIETLIGKKGKDQKTMHEVPVAELVEYAAEDADITLQLYHKLAPQVQDHKIFADIEQPLMPILGDMEYEGIRLDSQALADYSTELEQRLVVLEKSCYELAGEAFNLNSPKQLGEILFEKLGMGKGDKAKRTKTGQYVTDESTLLELARQHELPGQLLAYRSIRKLKSTYVDALPQMIHPGTGRIHTTYRQTVAVTGRLSSENPNLQNIPIRSEDGREVRKGFIPRNDDYVLMSADYSQVELRIMAAMSGDESMIEAFRAGEDIHRASAARVFGVAPEAVTPAQRSGAKTVNFGIIYGISAFGLADRMNISRSEAKDIIDTYFRQYPRIKAYMDESVQFARDHGYVETYFGRRRYLPDITSRNQTIRSFAERNAINSPIQGTAADVIKLAMIRIHPALRAAGLRSRMILQVHDELVFDVHRDEVEQVRDLVRSHMVQAVELPVPMVVEIGTGRNWLEAH
ncbi:MAG: DNA polymerase I [Bacteroidia bacterium]